MRVRRAQIESALEAAEDTAHRYHPVVRSRRRPPPGGLVFFCSSRRRHTRWPRDWSSDVCSSDMQGHIRGPYVPNEFIGVKRPEENGDCNQFEILKQFATPEEVRQDEEQILHDDGLCNPDRCLVCLDEAMERRNREELEAKTCACGHVKERHYWTRKRGETVQLYRDCRECLGFERPDTESGFTVEESQSRWAYERQA